jgi:flavorubredoxin
LKINIAYDSKFGNGKICVEYLESVLSKKGHDVQLFSIRKTKPESLPDADLYIFSTPTHVGHAPFKIKGFLKNLRIPNTGANYTVMTTCMDTNTKALEKMNEILQKYNLKKVSDGIKIKVLGLKGPLNENYQQQLDTFVNQILSSK